MKKLIAAVVLVGWVGIAGAATLTWTDNSNPGTVGGEEQGFNIYRKAEACAGTGAFGLQATVPTNTVTYVDTLNLIEGRTYCYRLTAFNAGGESVPSNSVDFTVPFTVPLSPSGLTVKP